VSHSLSSDEPVRVWGVPFVPWTLARTIDEVDHLVAARAPRYFMTVNLHTTMLAAGDPAVQAAIAGAAFVVADGMPLVWASRLRARRLPERVTGADLFPALCSRAAQRGYRVFFLGGPPGVGAAAAEKLVARFPGLQVVGTESPPYRPLTAREEAELLDRIRAAAPQLLFISFSQPAGDTWVHRHHAALGGAVCANIGAALDFAAGRISRAPRWMQRTGLEWAYRLSREPRRLFGRYARNAAFVARMLFADFQDRKRRAHPRAQAPGGRGPAGGSAPGSSGAAPASAPASTK
jgi:N-acetylglucosaminyldiphosphoundecaprenol N-acetyl-beta-D-mannosaminyltransferase